MNDASEPDGAPRRFDWNDPEVSALRSAMLRFARINLRDAAAAEDMVQEALLAAMQSADGFDGRSALRTWMFSILRNKIVDHLRRSTREVSRSQLAADEDEADEKLDGLFNRKIAWSASHWNAQDRPCEWSDPDAALSQKQFWTVFDTCVNHLPENLSRVFMMRELLDLDTPEICTELGISTSNCWVILHRARTRLRECLENNWFQGEPGKC